VPGEDPLDRVPDRAPGQRHLLDDRGGDVDLRVDDPLAGEPPAEVGRHEGVVLRRAEQDADVPVEGEKGFRRAGAPPGPEGGPVGEPAPSRPPLGEVDGGRRGDGPLEVDVKLGLREAGKLPQKPRDGGGERHVPSYATGERALLYAGGAVPPERRWLRPAATGIDLLVLAGGPLVVATATVFSFLLLAPDSAASLPALFRIAQAVALALFLLRDAPSGGSPGKRLLGLRVVRADRREVGPRESLLRNLTLLVPLWNLFELRSLLVRPDGRRPGDRLAGTVVLEG